MSEPIKNNVAISVCTEGAAPKDSDMEGTAMQYASRVCGNGKVWSSFTAEVADAGTRLIKEINYYCKNVNASFFCREPQPGKGSNPSWEKGSPKPVEDKAPRPRPYE